MDNQMLFASAITTERDVNEASRMLVEQIRAQIAGRSPDFVLVFLSPYFRIVVSDLADMLRAKLNPTVLIGCTAEGVIGREQEIEREPAVALVAAHLPDVELIPFTLQSMDWHRTLSEEATLRQMVNAPPTSKLFMIVADPFTTPMDAVLEAFNAYYPNLPIIGGMASGAQRAGGNALLFNDRVLNNGAVGVAFAGAFDVDIIVSQGCRPVGQPFTVTSARENVIFSLEGQPPLARIQDLVTGMTPADRVLLQNGLYIGRAVGMDREALGRGDFLIRGVMGLDQESGVMVVGDYIDEGETVQFHLRDAVTAEEDLEMMLAPQLLYDPPCGGFLFSCNGRGTRLYNHPNGDINIIQKVLGEVNLAGFFCAGEIGPIGNKNFLHGHTASLALFRPQGEGN
ncbi:MAG: FIST C-terminal domain-containing protein [Chloroflexi bacterium]|nr:FIST C-terminal domain-containing protein [Chloroflexota bacterium]